MDHRSLTVQSFDASQWTNAQKQAPASFASDVQNRPLSQFTDTHDLQTSEEMISADKSVHTV